MSAERTGTVLSSGLVGTTGATSLSTTSRVLAGVQTVLFLALGLVLFVAPGWAAANFPWKVSTFVAMTMGGWYLGNGLMAWEMIRIWRFGSVYPCLVLLALFSWLETGVLALHANLLHLSTALGWPYLGAVGIASICALVWVVDWVRIRPTLSHEGEPVSRALRLWLTVFTIVVLIIAIFPILGYGQSGSIFPEKLTLFTLHAFGVFYLSIALGTLTLLRERNITPVLVFIRTGLALLYPITLAALLNLDRFDFIVHPGGLIYLGVYIVVGVAATMILVRRWMSQRTVNTAPEVQLQ